MLKEKDNIIADEEAYDWMLCEDDSTVEIGKNAHLTVEELDERIELGFKRMREELNNEK